MQIFLLSLFAFFSGAFASELSLGDDLSQVIVKDSEFSLHDDLAQAITKDRALRGNPNPLEMSFEERERETLLLCRIINNLIPNSGCTCSDKLLQLKISFTCAASPVCVPRLPLFGQVCTTPTVLGELQLRLLQLTVAVDMSACAANTTTVTDNAAVNINSDICATINSSAGIRGVGIDTCSLTFFNQTCNTCSACTRANGRTGLAFNCGFFAADVCLAFALPLRFGGQTASVSINDWVAPEPWQELAVSLAVQAAQIED